MRSLPFTLSLLVLLAGYLGYIVYTQKLPCVTPTTYALAATDARFGLSTSTIETDLKAAAAVWNDALGFDALVEAATGTPDLPVSFVYNQTQETVDTIDKISGDIDSLKLQLTDLANEYGTLKKQYDALNAQGRATQKMYDDLQALYGRYEVLRKKINADVAAGQKIPTGEVEEGRYVSDQSGTRISIYAFQDSTELMRTMIHEFGHSLGLGHVANPDSIMYPSNDKSQSLSLSKEDLAEMNRACGEARSSILGVLYTYEHNFLHALRLD